jgi:hypothetical protein
MLRARCQRTRWSIWKTECLLLPRQGSDQRWYDEFFAWTLTELLQRLWEDEHSTRAVGHQQQSALPPPGKSGLTCSFSHQM